mmetsp:Transcript_18558/g.42369  ORF Transcript_18558/g.42369 Transcript_18558/m.42369 type:complete len:453 (-) Transcript_18558:2216-3574(-)
MVATHARSREDQEMTYGVFEPEASAAPRRSSSSSRLIMAVMATGLCGMVVVGMLVHAPYLQTSLLGGSVDLFDVSAANRQRRTGLATEMSLADVSTGKHIVHLNVPLKDIAGLRVGATMKGKTAMLAADGTSPINAKDFTGKVRSLQMITVQGKIQSDVLGEPDEGVVSVKLLTDQFVAPGTAVTGMVAGKVFKGVVTKAPSLENRLDEAEKRMREMAPPVCDEICKLEKEIQKTQRRIQDYKDSRHLRKEADALEKRMDALEKPHPPPETVAILGNWAGFKFELPDGPNSYAPRVENIESRMDEIPKGYAVAFQDVYNSTRNLEKKLDEIEGLKTTQERMNLLRHELSEMESCVHAEASKEARAECIRRIMQENQFKTYHHHEAQEEYEKEPFVQPKDEEVPPEESEEEEKEEEKESWGREVVVFSHPVISFFFFSDELSGSILNTRNSKW